MCSTPNCTRDLDFLRYSVVAESPLIAQSIRKAEGIVVEELLFFCAESKNVPVVMIAGTPD